MNMVKSLLLGSAAGLVAIAGAQAADLPVKAKPVDYVKICSAYGAGFYYIPGTDICLRVGGYVFIETGWNARGGDQLIYSYTNGADMIIDRNDNTMNFRARGDLILDARSQTAIGTVRTYISIGQDYNNLLGGLSPPGVVSAYLERAFIQFAGFTVGQSASFFDFGAFYSIYALSSIAWNWNPVFAYTAQFGNGVSLTFSVEDGQSHRTALIGSAYVPTSVLANVYGGQAVPNFIANLRVDQTWGSAQISGALHQLRVNQATSVTTADSWGWAILGGIEIKLPSIAPGDSIMLQGVFSRGAVEFTGLSASPLASATAIGVRNTLGIGPVAQIYDAGNGLAAGLQLSDAYSANLMFRHFWQPNVRSAFWVGYNRYEPGGHDNLLFNASPVFTLWQVGANIIWSPAPTLDLSLDLMWASMATGNCPSTPGFIGLNCNVSADQWTAWTRWRRSF